MKLRKLNIGLGIIALAVLASCAEDKFSTYATDMPQDLADYQYLNDYEPLKNYIEQAKAAGKCNPDFKLGVALGATDFNKRELSYSLAASNFMELTTGNAMKYASCVKEDGSMDFSTVKEFVSNAKEAGLTVYGHTLAWHSQQNNKYLNKLIADKELPPASDNPGLVIKAGAPKANVWDAEIYYDLDAPLKAGKTYKLSLNVRATNAGKIDFWPGKKNGTDTQYGAGSIMLTNDAADHTLSFTPNADIERLRFCFGKVGGTIYFDNVVLKAQGDSKNLIVNSTFDGEDLSHWTKASWQDFTYMRGNVAAAASVDIETEVYKQTYTDGPFPFYNMGCTPPVVNGSIHFVPTGAWSQFFVATGIALTEGNYMLHLDLTASKAASGVQLTIQNGWGASAQSITLSIPVEAGHHDVKLSVPGIVGGNYDVILKPQTADATLDLKTVKVCSVKKANAVPLTDNEKKAILTTAMGTWIDKMMEAVDGYVTAWDVVNEPISGKDKDGDGWYDLQSATRGTVSPDDAKNNFYWQDYLGDIDYVRTAVAAARRCFAAHNGDAAKLKLFINDYNLESDWDDNKKLKSLIHWIEEWEKDGKTRIDGIGSQMHVSFSADPNTQKKKEEHVVKMLQLMAKSGKLVKISELDMGYNDAAGQPIMTENLTEEQHKQMRDYYKFIVGQYFKTVPLAQQYGITQWCITDAPKGSSWRGGEPTGLWNANFLRKHTYAGFADGLRGE